MTESGQPMPTPMTPIQVRLDRLKRNEAELVRTWRNSPEVQRHMFYSKYITAEQQTKWFDSIDNDANYFFLVRQNSRAIGVVNLKNVDRAGATAETGVFFGEPEDAIRGIVALAAAFALTEFAFGPLGLARLQSRVLKENTRAIHYNLGIGYELQPEQEHEENQLYCLTPERYRHRTASARQMIARRVQASVHP
jgi:UDP-4-amino-4,6-dideoxy-N-acetyl-beta-L-altrosamine N-acetyltransferase